MARRAEDIGMSVTDDTVNQFLKQTSRGRAGDELWQKLLDRHGLTDKQFFALLRTELLGVRFGELFGPSVGATTPAQRWDYFTRLKQEATIEALPIRVADYIGQVEDPDEETLKAFFEQHRNDYDLSTSPTPGFRQPERVNVRYFRLVPSQIEKSVSAAAIKCVHREEQGRAGTPLRSGTQEAGYEEDEDKKTEEDRRKEDRRKEDRGREAGSEEDRRSEDRREEDGRREAGRQGGSGKTEEKKTEEKKTEPESKEPAKEPDAMEPESKEPAKEPEADKTSARSAVGGFQFAAFLQEGGRARRRPKRPPRNPRTRRPRSPTKCRPRSRKTNRRRRAKRSRKTRRQKKDRKTRRKKRR